MATTTSPKQCWTCLFWDVPLERRQRASRQFCTNPGAYGISTEFSFHCALWAALVEPTPELTSRPTTAPAAGKQQWGSYVMPPPMTDCPRCQSSNCSVSYQQASVTRTCLNCGNIW